MTIDTLNLVQLNARFFLDSNAPLPLDKSFHVHMTVLTADLLDPFSVMTFRTDLQDGLPVVFSGRMTVGAFQAAARVASMGELDIIERNISFF